MFKGNRRCHHKITLNFIFGTSEYFIVVYRNLTMSLESLNNIQVMNNYNTIIEPRKHIVAYYDLNSNNGYSTGWGSIASFFKQLNPSWCESYIFIYLLHCRYIQKILT